LIALTNINIIKENIIAKSYEGFQLFQSETENNYEKNKKIYFTIVKNIGDVNLRKMDREQQIRHAIKILPQISGVSGEQKIEEQAIIFAQTYQAVNGVTIINYQLLFIIILAFYVAEIVLLIRFLLMKNSYKREVLRLECIVELLGSIEHGIKTDDIIMEMVKSAKVYKKNLNECVQMWTIDRTIALRNLKNSSKNSRFSKLVDVIRIYTTKNTNIAIEILKRNRADKEQEMLMTAEENIDVVDIIAFVTILPIMWETSNMLLKPMLDVVFQAFKYA
jgi:hypothetical protein